jgi:hypothetical protein
MGKCVSRVRPGSLTHSYRVPASRAFAQMGHGLDGRRRADLPLVYTRLFEGMLFPVHAQLRTCSHSTAGWPAVLCAREPRRRRPRSDRGAHRGVHRPLVRAPASGVGRRQPRLHHLRRRTRQARAAAVGRRLLTAHAPAVLFLSLEFPPLQPVVAHAFAEAMAPLANGTRLLRFMRHAAGRPDPGDLTRFAVTCADSPAPVPAPSAGELAGEQMRALARSRFGTSVVYTDVSTRACPHVRAADRRAA